MSISRRLTLLVGSLLLATFLTAVSLSYLLWRTKRNTSYLQSTHQFHNHICSELIDSSTNIRANIQNLLREKEIDKIEPLVHQNAQLIRHLDSILLRIPNPHSGLQLSLDRFTRTNQELLDAFLVGDNARSQQIFTEIFNPDFEKIVSEIKILRKNFTQEEASSVEYFHRRQSHVEMAIYLCLTLAIGFALFLGFRIRLRIIEIAGQLTQAKIAAEAANVTKGNFLAMMSHEIRTPLNGVIGFASLMTYTPLSEEQKEYTEAITSSGKTLLQLINDILDYSKIEAHRLELHVEPFSIRELIQNTFKMLSRIASGKNLKLEYHLSPDLPDAWTLDKLRLQQVLINLLSNSLKFTSEGYVKLSVSCVNPQTLRFEIEDTGVGIAPEHVKKLFQPFVQADSSITRKFGGTGLGLTISKNLVELMGGTISFDSIPHQKTIFQFTIVGEQTHSNTETSSAPVISSPSSPSLRILLAEDNPMNQRLFKILLEKMGYQPLIVTNGKKALEACQKQIFDLILMDLQMPEMNGFEAAQKIRELPSFQEITIIALTANILSHSQEELQRSGIDGILGKPLKQETFHLFLKTFSKKRSRSS